MVVRSDGSVWFTDPNYGIISDYVGEKRPQELDGCNVFRIDPLDGSLAIVADDFSMPNGLAFSPDESVLYVATLAFLRTIRLPIMSERSMWRARNSLRAEFLPK